MHFMINHVCGWKTKACEIKVSIYVHVYSATSEILESKKKKIQANGNWIGITQARNKLERAT